MATTAPEHPEHSRRVARGSRDGGRQTAGLPLAHGRLPGELKNGADARQYASADLLCLVTGAADDPRCWAMLFPLRRDAMQALPGGL